MRNKGERVVSKTVVLERKNNAYNSNDVECQIYTSELSNLKDQDVIVEVAKRNKNQKEILAEYVTSVYSKEAGITLKTNIIEENDLLPGEKVIIDIYERNVQIDLEDDAAVIGRAKAFGSKNAPDGVDSRLYCAEVYGALDESGTILKYRNTRTGKEAKGEAVPHNEKNGISFRQDVRRAIDAEPNDLIEILGTENTPPEQSDKGTTNRETAFVDTQKLNKMYEMISELHEAYTEKDG